MNRTRQSTFAEASADAAREGQPPTRTLRSLLAWIAFVATLWAVTPARAADRLETMAEELARLRSEVEILSSNIEDEKETTRSEMRALAAQRASVEADVQRESLRLAQLDQEVARLKQRVRAAGDRQDALREPVLGAIQRLRENLRAGIPFRVTDRERELDELTAGVRGATILPSVAVTRLWTWVEDELRLTRENGLHQQVILLGEHEVLCDVARVGMVALYFRAPDGRVGAARRLGDSGRVGDGGRVGAGGSVDEGGRADDGGGVGEGRRAGQGGRVGAVRSGDDGWRYEPFADAVAIEQTKALFAALEKRVRVGFFELPYALGEVSR